MSSSNHLDRLNSQVQQIMQASQPDMSGVYRALESVNEEKKARTAGGFFERIADRIQHFEAELDQEFEVGVRLVSFGQALTFSVTSIGYIDPLLIVFHGVMDSGDPVELIQHVNQISFVLIRLKRPEPEKPRQPIGFAVA